MAMTRVALAIGLTLMSSLPAAALEGPIAVADRLLDNLRSFSSVPGHASAVVVNGELVWEGVSGLADLDG